MDSWCLTILGLLIFSVWETYREADAFGFAITDMDVVDNLMSFFIVDIIGMVVAIAVMFQFRNVKSSELE